LAWVTWVTWMAGTSNVYKIWDDLPSRMCSPSVPTCTYVVAMKFSLWVLPSSWQKFLNSDDGWILMNLKLERLRWLDVVWRGTAGIHRIERLR
jgi:hypothetical protein